MTRPHYGSVVVIDPHGKLASEIAHWKEFARNDRLVYIQPSLSASYTPVINPFELKHLDDPQENKRVVGVMAQELERVIEEVASEGGGGSLTGQMTVVARHSATGMLYMGGDLATLQRLMLDAKNGDLIERVKRIGSRKSKEFFRTSFDRDSYTTTRHGIYNRLELLLSLDAFHDATIGRSTLDLKRALNSRKVIVFNLRGMGKDAYSAFGRFIIAYILGIALQRDPEADNVPIHLFVDECHNFLTESVKTILKETRKFGLHLTLAQQEVGESMSEGLKRAVLSNCNVVLAGSSDSRSQNAILRRTKATEEDLALLGEGRFLLYIDRLQRKAPVVPVQVRSDLVDQANSMTAAEWERVQAEQLKRYYRPIAQLRGELKSTETGEIIQERKPGMEPAQKPKRRVPKFRFGNE